MLKKGFFTDQEEINHLLKDLQSRNRGGMIGKDLKTNFSACTFDWDEFPSGINFFSIRKKGKGKIEKTCQSKICKYTVWAPTKSKVISKLWGKSAYLVHHNFAKSNQMKIERAKEYGLWLNVEADDWFDQ